MWDDAFHQIRSMFQLNLTWFRRCCLQKLKIATMATTFSSAPTKPQFLRLFYFNWKQNKVWIVIRQFTCNTQPYLPWKCITQILLSAAVVIGNFSPIIYRFHFTLEWICRMFTALITWSYFGIFSHSEDHMLLEGMPKLLQQKLIYYRYLIQHIVFF